MKRIKAACLTQTLHFLLKEDLDKESAVKHVNEEVSAYKSQLERRGIQHRIISEETQEDGSVIIEIRKQYNSSPVGQYLD